MKNIIISHTGIKLAATSLCVAVGFTAPRAWAQEDIAPTAHAQQLTGTTNAIHYAKQAEQKGDTALAMLYCLNAINREPGNIEYYRYLSELSNKQGNELTENELEQLSNVMELAVYQVNPEYLMEVKKKAKEYRSRIDDMQRTDVPQISEKEIQGEWERWQMKVYIEQKDDAEAQVKNLAGYMSFLREVEGMGFDAEKNTAEMKRVSTLAVFYDLKDKLENILATVKESETGAIPREKLPAFASQIRAAESYLAQIWSLNLEDVTPKNRQRIDAICCELKAAEQRCADASVAAFIRVASAVLENVSPSESDVVALGEMGINFSEEKANVAQIYQLPKGRIQGIRTREIQQLLCNLKLIERLLSSVDANSESVTAFMKKHALAKKELENKLVERNREYQKIALNSCENGWKKYRSINYFADNDALDIIEKYLAPIDPSLLDARSSSIYNSLLQVCIGQLGNGKKRLNGELMLSSKDKYVHIESL